jgi:hypothetical protein
VPYRDFAVEYPPLALPLFLAPRLVAGGLSGYKLAFAAEMLAFHAATVVLVAAWVGRREGPERVAGALSWSTVYFAMLAPFVVARYDPAPAFLSFAAAVDWAEGRGARGGLAAALGALAKVFPALVAPFGVAADLDRKPPARWRGAASWAATLAAGVAAWILLGGVRGVGASLRYHLVRGFEYESLGSGLQTLAARLVGAEVTESRDHISFSTVTPWSPALAALALPLQAAALLAVFVTFLRRGRREVVRYAGAAVLAFALTGKVFSPQYLVWVAPFVAAQGGPVAARARRLFAAGCALALAAPAAIPYASRTGLGVILLVNLKNLALLGLLAALTFGPEGRVKLKN